jgi:acyl-CoA reductase-like NAD-dependent aldehyde dehydrogenase
VAAARRAFDDGVGLHEARAARRLLLRLAELMERDAQVLAELEVIDNGKILPMARHGDLTIAIDRCAIWRAGPPRSRAPPSAPRSTTFPA